MAEAAQDNNNQTVGEQSGTGSRNKDDKVSHNGEVLSLNNAQDVAANGENGDTAESVATNKDTLTSRPKRNAKPSTKHSLPLLFRQKKQEWNNYALKNRLQLLLPKSMP